MLKDLLGSGVDIQMDKMQKQTGATDCSLFAIAIFVSLANDKDPGEFCKTDYEVISSSVSKVFY